MIGQSGAHRVVRVDGLDGEAGKGKRRLIERVHGAGCDEHDRPAAKREPRLLRAAISEPISRP